MSSKLFSRRGVPTRPHVCHPPPPPPPIIGPPSCDCEFSPPELFGGPYIPYAFYVFVSCPALGDATAQVHLGCSGGEWQDPDFELGNGYWSTDKIWVSPGMGGDYTLTATFTFPGGTECVATATAHIEGEP